MQSMPKARKLGFDLYRDAWDTPRRPAGAYHEVVQIIVFTKQREGARHAARPAQEIRAQVGGHTVAPCAERGDVPCGAARELREETGIAVSEAALTLIDRQVRTDPAVHLLRLRRDCAGQKRTDHAAARREPSTASSSRSKRFCRRRTARNTCSGASSRAKCSFAVYADAIR